MIIAVDFDGTLHDGEFPNIGEPLEEAVNVMKNLHLNGHYLILWTCRCGDKLTEAINWLLDNDIPFDRVNEHEPSNLAKYESNARKVYAHVYIDDRQVGGLPHWKNIYKYITDVERRYQEGINGSTKT